MTGQEFCSKCYCASRQEWYYGCKLHAFVMLRPNRVPLLVAAQVSTASLPDLFAARKMDLDCTPISNGTLFADKAYCDAGWIDFMSRNREISVVTPRKKKKYDVLLSSDCFSTSVSSLRQPVESFFHWIHCKSGILDASRARSLSGIFFHIFSSLAFTALLSRFYY